MAADLGVIVIETMLSQVSGCQVPTWQDLNILQDLPELQTAQGGYGSFQQQYFDDQVVARVYDLNGGSHDLNDYGLQA